MIHERDRLCCDYHFSYKRADVHFPKRKFRTLEKNIKDVSKKLPTLAKILDPVRNLTERDKALMVRWVQGENGFQSMVNATERNMLSIFPKVEKLSRLDNSVRGKQLQKVMKSQSKKDEKRIKLVVTVIFVIVIFLL